MHRIGRFPLYITIIATFIIEGTFLNLMSIGDIKPNLMLIVIIFVGLHSDLARSLEAAFLGGLLRGIAGVGSVGMAVVIFGITALFANYCRNKVFKENFLTQIILTLFVTAAVNGLILFTKVIIKEIELIEINLRRLFVFTVLSLSLYTALLAPPVFLFLKKVLKARELRS